MTHWGQVRLLWIILVLGTICSCNCAVNFNRPRVNFVDIRINPVPAFKIIAEPIAQIFANDEYGNELHFSIEGESSKFFKINDKGEIRLRKVLDPREGWSHTLTIVIRDATLPPIYWVTADVTLSVLVVEEDIDFPKSPPIFVTPPVIRSVQEELPLGTIIFKVEAKDIDDEFEWPIQYDIEDELDLFQINSVSGEITVKNRIDAESLELIMRGQKHSFVVTASEVYNQTAFSRLSPQLTQTREEANFRIVDIDDEEPKVCAGGVPDICLPQNVFYFTISEDFTGHVPLNTVLIVDDKDVTIQYNSYTANFSSGTPPFVQCAFSIRPTHAQGRQEFTVSIVNSTCTDFESRNWDDGLGNPRPVSFQIEFKGENASVATANISATVTDVNDNRPIFQLPPTGEENIEFVVCENQENGDPLFTRLPSEVNPGACKGSKKVGHATVVAVDADLTPAFGTESIRYRWKPGSKEPPLKLDSVSGKLYVNKEDNFDRERNSTELYTVEAVDSWGWDGGASTLIGSAGVLFTILDRNDEPVDLNITDPKGTNISVTEFTPSNTIILEGITVTDPDLTANLRIELELLQFWSGLKRFPVREIPWGEGELVTATRGIEKWFGLKIVKEESLNKMVADLVIQASPSRTAFKPLIIDKVELLLRAIDYGSEPKYEDGKIAEALITIYILERPY